MVIYKFSKREQEIIELAKTIGYLQGKEEKEKADEIEFILMEKFGEKFDSKES